jgi:hypothetical protein
MMMTNMAVGSKPLDRNREKLSLQDQYPPRPARNRSIGKKTMGVGLTVMTTMAVGSKPLDLNREKYRSRTYTPPRGEERDSGKRTMGISISASVNEDRTTRKLSLQDQYPW